MPNIKQTWKLINLDNGKSVTYNKFDKLESDCKALMNLNRDKNFRITYFENSKEQEKVELTVYF